jgi:putative transcriptional regulator
MRELLRSRRIQIGLRGICSRTPFRWNPNGDLFFYFTRFLPQISLRNLRRLLREPVPTERVRATRWFENALAVIVNRALTRFADDASVPEGDIMQRLRLKADGRIVELRDGREIPLAPMLPASAQPAATMAGSQPAVRDLRRRAQLTQLEFAAKLGVPVETIRNWEQGKRAPRGPARALLAVIAHSPETVFAALSSEPTPA